MKQVAGVQTERLYKKGALYDVRQNYSGKIRVFTAVSELGAFFLSAFSLYKRNDFSGWKGNQAIIAPQIKTRPYRNVISLD